MKTKNSVFQSPVFLILQQTFSGFWNSDSLTVYMGRFRHNNARTQEAVYLKIVTILTCMSTLPIVPHAITKGIFFLPLPFFFPRQKCSHRFIVDEKHFFWSMGKAHVWELEVRIRGTINISDDMIMMMMMMMMMIIMMMMMIDFNTYDMARFLGSRIYLLFH